MDVTRFQDGRVCFINSGVKGLTLKMPRKPASENVVCLCCLLNILQSFQTYFCIQANSVDPDQTAPRGAVRFGPHCFQNHKQTTVVVIGSLRVKIKPVFRFQETLVNLAGLLCSLLIVPVVTGKPM